MDHRIKWSWVIREGVTKEAKFELNVEHLNAREMMARHFR